MNYFIRSAYPSDIESLIQIEQSANQAFAEISDLAWIKDSPPISYEMHLNLMMNNHSIVTTDHSNCPIGFIYAQKNENDLYILEIDASQQFQKQGIGTSLINQLILYAKKNNIQKITLTTFTHVIWNKPFYEKLGFDVFHEDLPKYIAQKIRQETARGLSKDTRCAMYLNI